MSGVPSDGAPMVRVVVLNYNGGEMVLRSLRSLLAVEWPRDRLQVVCVDNASTDGSVEAIVAELPEVEIRRNPVNLGFPGNNVALVDLEGIDYVGLVNNDAYVDRQWVHPLVEVLERDPGLGATCPKILLEPKFVELSIRTGDTAGRWDESRGDGVRLRGVRCNGVDVFSSINLGATGFGREADGRGVFEWTKRVATVRVPVGVDVPDRLAVSVLLDAPRPRAVRLDGGCGTLVREVGSESKWFDVDVRGVVFDVVNNVGSTLLGDGYGVDNGWLERDRGQLDDMVDVFAWCGGSVMLRADYLRDVGHFDERFFLYYEDTDLSWRGALRGWRYRTVPSSIVRHTHATSSVEASAVFAHFTERNRLLVLLKNAPVRLVVRQLVRFILITGSYGRRDIIVPLLRLKRPVLTNVRRRLASFIDFFRLAPGTVGERRRIRRSALVPDRRVLAALGDRPD